MGKKFFVVGFRRVFVERESGKREKERKKKRKNAKGNKNSHSSTGSKEKKGQHGAPLHGHHVRALTRTRAEWICI